jgi:hypothetical protein
MKLGKSTFAALLVSGSVGLGVNSAEAHDMFSQGFQSERNLTKIEGD